jgi:hypothetical protein
MEGRNEGGPAWEPALLHGGGHISVNGDNGAGVGASHQTGWTGLVAVLIDPMGRAGEDKEGGN